jgi:hypothetical protein
VLNFEAEIVYLSGFIPEGLEPFTTRNLNFVDKKQVACLNFLVIPILHEDALNMKKQTAKYAFPAERFANAKRLEEKYAKEERGS